MSAKENAENIRNALAEKHRLLLQEINRQALAEQSEPDFHRIRGIGVIEFCNVNTSIVAGTQTSATVSTQVTGLAVTVAGNNQINLSWTANVTADYYRVYRSTTSGSGFVLIASPSSNSFQNIGLIAGTTYYYKVSGVNQVGEGSQSTQGQGTTTGTAPPLPSQPTGLSVTTISSSQLNLSWSTAANSDSYNIYRSTTSGSGFSVVATSAVNSYSDSGLTGGTTYYYKVSGVNTVGEGTLSSQASGTTTAIPINPDLLIGFDNTVADQSGNGNSVGGTAIAYGTPGKFGTHYYVQNTGATQDYLTVTASSSTALDMVNGFSYSFWMYPTVASQGCLIIDKITDTNNRVEVGLTFGELFIAITKAGTVYGYKINHAANAWQHVVVTFNPSGGSDPSRLYLDKVAATTANVSGFGASHTNLIIGDGSAAMDLVFKGRLDEFQYFKGKVLTQTQVNNLFATNVP